MQVIWNQRHQLSCRAVGQHDVPGPIERNPGKGIVSVQEFLDCCSDAHELPVIERDLRVSRSMTCGQKQ